MVIAIIRPNATGLNNWMDGNHLSVDDAVEEPDAGDGTCIRAWQANGDDNDQFLMTFPNTIADVDEVTNVTMWMRGLRVGNNSPEGDIRMGVAWKGLANMVVGVGYTWVSISWNGSWTQANLDNAAIGFAADVPDKSDKNEIDVIYLLVTYTPVASGWGHKFLGVPAANIAKVNGVPIANIASIKGVVI